MKNIAAHKLKAEQVPTVLRSGLLLGLGAFDKEKEALVAWGKLTYLSAPAKEAVSFFVPDFYLSKSKAWVVFENIYRIQFDDILDALKEFAKQPLLDLRWKSADRSAFMSAFLSVKKKIDEKLWIKAVPAACATATGSATLAFRAHALKNLIENRLSATPYGYWTEYEGILGVSPEILFTIDASKGMIQSMALAGTCKSENEESLLKDPKLQLEHKLVAEEIKDKLAIYGTVMKEDPRVWNFGSLSHLRSKINANYETKISVQELFLELVEKMHPTAALGVLPDKLTMNGSGRNQWRMLKELDGNFDRHRFGAPFGFCDAAGLAGTLVAIRNLQWKEDQLSIWAGCGVVGASDFESEWQELLLKIHSVRQRMGLKD